MYNAIKLSAGVGAAAAANGGAIAAPHVQSPKRMSQIMLAAAGGLLLVALLIFTLLNGRIEKAEKTEAAKAAEVGSGQQVAKRFDSAMTDYNNTQAQLRHLETSVAPSAYVPTLLPQIQKLAQSYSCQVSSIKPGVIGGVAPGSASAPTQLPANGAPAAPAAALPYQTMTLSLNLIGSYSNIMHFVYSLTQFPKIVSVMSISLHPGSTPGQLGAETASNSADHSLTADIELQAYLFTDIAGTALAGQAAKPAAATPGAAPMKSAVAQAVGRPVDSAIRVKRQSEAQLNQAGVQAGPARTPIHAIANLGRS